MKIICTLAVLFLSGCATSDWQGINWSAAQPFVNQMNAPAQPASYSSSQTCYADPMYSYNGTYLGTKVRCR
jgi:hypothetical protein